MIWISVKERTPKKGEQVLVFGYLDTELSSNRVPKPTVGLVEWGSEKKSDCSDMCYYHMEYQDITHWCEVPKEPSLIEDTGE